MKGVIIKGPVLALAVLSPWVMNAWGSSGNEIIQAMDFNTGQLIPIELPHPETWICLGIKRASNGALLQALWVKPIAMTPRDIVGSSHAEAKAAYVQANRECGKPLVLSPPPHSESFEYLDFTRGSSTPATFLEKLQQRLSKDCPSASLTPITMNDTELLYEIKSGGCPPVGEQEEIDRVLFGKRDLFSMFYKVNAHEMTPEQREAGIKAVTAWKMR